MRVPTLGKRPLLTATSNQNSVVLEGINFRFNILGRRERAGEANTPCMSIVPQRQSCARFDHEKRVSPMAYYILCQVGIGWRAGAWLAGASVPLPYRLKCLCVLRLQAELNCTGVGGCARVLRGLECNKLRYVKLDGVGGGSLFSCFKCLSIYASVKWVVEAISVLFRCVSVPLVGNVLPIGRLLLPLVGGWWGLFLPCRSSLRSFQAGGVFPLRFAFPCGWQ